MFLGYPDNFETVWEMGNHLENPDSFEIVRKIGTHLKNPGSFATIRKMRNHPGNPESFNWKYFDSFKTGCNFFQAIWTDLNLSGQSSQDCDR